jgi:hypothetical protein
VPVEKRAHVQSLIDRRNKFAGQAAGLQARVNKLEAKIAAVDAEIAAACE